MTGKPVALLVMHYGTPDSLEDVPAYYTHIRRGRPPEPEDLEDLISRYRAIGGPSPLKAISEAQAQAILEGVREAGINVRLYIGAKHTPPFVGDAVRQIAVDGIDQVIALVLAPHYSSFSVAAYRKYALEARDEVAPDMRIDFIERWGELAALISALADRVKAELLCPTGGEASANTAAPEKRQPLGPTGREALAKPSNARSRRVQTKAGGEALVTGHSTTKGAEDFWSRFEEPAEKSSAPTAATHAWDPDETIVIFTAHSLPKRIMAEGDPYVEELLATSRLVAEKAGVKNWKFAFQSASKTGESWLGPDILEVIDEEASHYENILACTIGFVSDHLEVLYDLDIETREHCEKLGVNYRRADTIGADQTVMKALAKLCAETLAKTSNALT